MLMKSVTGVIQTCTSVEDMFLETYSKCSGEADVSPAGCGSHPAYPHIWSSVLPYKKTNNTQTDTHRQTHARFCPPRRCRGRESERIRSTEGTGCRRDVTAHTTTVVAVISQHLVVPHLLLG